MAKLRIPSSSTSFKLEMNRPHHSRMLDGFTMDDIEYLAGENPSFRGYLQGYLAELALMRKLEAIEGVDLVEKIPDHDTRKGDFRIIYKGTEVTIEVKSVATGKVKEHTLTASWRGTVLLKSSKVRTVELGDGRTVTCSNLLRNQFDILAVSCFIVSGTWNFLFVENRLLPESEEFPGFISNSLNLNPEDTIGVTSDIESLFIKVLERKASESMLK